MEWVSVNDRLPEKDGEYIVQYRDNSVGCASFADSLTNVRCLRWFDGTDSDHPGFYVNDADYYGEYEGAMEVVTVKYWQPLPEPVSETKPKSKYAKKLDDVFDNIEHYIIEKYNIVLDDKDEEFLEKASMAMMMAFVGLIFEGSLVSDRMSKTIDSELEKYGY